LQTQNATLFYFVQAMYKQVGRFPLHWGKLLTTIDPTTYN